jgi:small subunit ribosomal protein S27e
MWIPEDEARYQVEEAGDREMNVMKRHAVPIPIPRSRFLVVRCNNCGQERVVYSHSTHTIRCKTCNEELVTPTGGKSDIRGSIVRVLE